MATPDPETGKQPSGAKNRKIAKEKESEAERCERLRREAGFDSSKLLEMEPPPTGVVGLIVWGQRVQAKALYAVLQDPAMKFETKLRFISDFTKALGMTHSKAVTDERIQKLEKKSGIAKGQHDDDGLEPDEEYSPG